MLPKRNFGSTGCENTRAVFGGASIGDLTQKEADETFKILVKYGVNHLDTSISYGDSELRIKPWMEDHRDEFFLATKTDGRTYEAARDEIRRSLDRLGVERLDLLQIHALEDPEECDVIFGEDGSIEALKEARDEEIAHFLGVTGHGLLAPKALARCLDEFDFDSVLLPFNFLLMQNKEYASDFRTLQEKCEEKNVAIQTTKSIARRRWEDEEQDRQTWYKPLENQEEIDRAVHWVLSHDVFLCTVGDVNLLPKVLDAASKYEGKPSDEEMEDQVDRLDMKPLWGGNYPEKCI